MPNKIASVLIIAASLGLGTAAMAQGYAAQKATGVITSISVTDKTVTLADGQTCLLPAGYNIGLLTNGQKVALNCEQVGGQMQVKALQFSAS